MGQPLAHLSFEQWLAHVFAHPVPADDRAWYWDPEADWWNGPAAETIQHLTAAFENAGAVLRPFSDAQLKHGLWYLADTAGSNHMLALLDPSVAWPERQRCLRSIHSLFADCLAKRCTPHLSHLDEPGASPLNVVCYMWWDIAPLAGQPEEPARADLDREVLGVLEATLHLEALACQESALHGLGHWHWAYPDRVTDIIDRYLAGPAAADARLRAYAGWARRGCVQ